MEFDSMHTDTHHRALTIIALLLVGIAMIAPTASADATSENVTKLKDGILEVLSTWIPFVILFTLIGLALAALGIHLFRQHG